MTFAHALGSVRTGDLSRAQAEIERLESARDAAKGMDPYWSAQIEVQRRAAAAMLAHAQGKSEEALAGMRAAAELETSIDKHPVTPGAVLPARELLGDLLLEMNLPRAALGEYEQSLTTDPNRFRSLYGAAIAAQRAGDKAKAKGYYRQSVELGGEADTIRPELAEARAYPQD